MRVVCPSCGAVYAVPDSALASRRLMRCARCAHEFTPPELAEPEPEQEEPPEIVPEPIEPPAAPSVAVAAEPVVGRDVKAQVLAGWVASFLLLTVLVFAGVAWRKPVMRVWPASARLYSVMGLP